MLKCAQDHFMGLVSAPGLAPGRFVFVILFEKGFISSSVYLLSYYVPTLNLKIGNKVYGFGSEN